MIICCSCFFSNKKGPNFSDPIIFLNVLNAIPLIMVEQCRNASKYRLGTSVSGVKNKSILLKADLIDESEGKLSFLDSGFDYWF